MVWRVAGVPDDGSKYKTHRAVGSKVFFYILLLTTKRIETEYLLSKLMPVREVGWGKKYKISPQIPILFLICRIQCPGSFRELLQLTFVTSTYPSYRLRLTDGI